MISQAAGLQRAHCMVLLAKMAVEAYSRTAEDKAARCRCGGRGKVVDQAASRAAGATVEKVCPRCHGSGLKPLTSASAYKVINTLIPELTQRTWSRNWKNFYDSLITRCHQEAAAAQSFFEQIT
ncbi:antitermination protein [Affinibrenneria salicis]|nr:antitermination protein [Affinibrenneria salicis]